jgi:1,2-diacylglycerol 3-beta-galactosyltransferase
MTSVLIAYSDTGGGHRSAALALRDALVVLRPDVDTVLVDPYTLSARWPFSRLSRSYPLVIEHAPWLWQAGFAATNTPQRVALAQSLAWPALRGVFTTLAATHDPDVIVSTHPLLTAPLRRAFRHTPIVVVVTDLVSGHVSWYSTDADAMAVPTLHARERAIAAGVDATRITVSGVPVARRYVTIPGERAALLSQLAWAPNKPTVLLAGGAEGIGPLEAIAVAIDRAHLPCDIAIVAGRNRTLAARLRARQWQGTVHIYDFASNFAEMMRAASVLVTKAGPGTIMEACASACPMILSGAIPGQEIGNVEFVTRGRAGVWAPSPLAVTAALHAWLVGRDAAAAMRRAAMSAHRLACHDAAHDAALLTLATAREPAPVAHAPNHQAA